MVTCPIPSCPQGDDVLDRRPVGKRIGVLQKVAGDTSWAADAGDRAVKRDRDSSIRWVRRQPAPLSAHIPEPARPGSIREVGGGVIRSNMRSRLQVKHCTQNPLCGLTRCGALHVDTPAVVIAVTRVRNAAAYEPASPRLRRKGVARSRKPDRKRERHDRGGDDASGPHFQTPLVYGFAQGDSSPIGEGLVAASQAALSRLGKQHTGAERRAATGQRLTASMMGAFGQAAGPWAPF